MFNVLGEAALDCEDQGSKEIVINQLVRACTKNNNYFNDYAICIITDTDTTWGFYKSCHNYW